MAMLDIAARDGKFMKAPVNPYRGHVASVTDPDEWSGFEQAKWAREGFGAMVSVFY
jgi:hypothetical protein